MSTRESFSWRCTFIPLLRLHTFLLVLESDHLYLSDHLMHAAFVWIGRVHIEERFLEGDWS